MSKKPKRNAKRKASKPTDSRPPAEENRSAEAATVAWMLSVMATAAADLASLALWLLGRFWPAAPDPPAAGAAFVPLLFLFIAAMTGLVCLVLTPVVYRVRSVPPPVAITIFAVVASAIPLGVFVALLAR